MLDQSMLVTEVRATKHRFASLCYRFQELRYIHAELAAVLQEAANAPGDVAPAPARPVFPLYGFSTSASGVLSLVRQPSIIGGTGRTFIRCWEEAAPEATVLHVEGEVDVATAPILAQAIAAAFRRARRLIVHLGRVRYLDGSAIRVLEDASRADGTRMVVIGSAPHVHRLFDILELNDVLPVVPDLNAARAYLRKE